MAYSYSHTLAKTFTRTSARYITSKVVADLHLMQIYYGQPSDAEIIDYFSELTELLVYRYVAQIEYGFQRNGNRIVSFEYTVRSDGTLEDNRAGRVYARADINGTDWFSFLTYSNKWWKLTPDQRANFSSQLPVQRTTGNGPGDGVGYWVIDRLYSSDGVGTQRRIFRPY